MTEIESRLASDLIAATRSRAPELTLLRSLKAALHNEKIAKNVQQDLADSDVVAVFRRELKKRQEAATMYKQAGRAELANKEEEEIKVIAKYLPVAPPVEEIKKVLERLKQEQGLSGMQAMGPLTKAVMAHFKGSVDGQTVSSLAKEILNQS